MSINRNDVSHSINTQMDSLIPASKISTLTQGMFVGAVSDNFDERIRQKIFHAEIVVDNKRVRLSASPQTPDYATCCATSNYTKINALLSFADGRAFPKNYER